MIVLLYLILTKEKYVYKQPLIYFKSSIEKFFKDQVLIHLLNRFLFSTFVQDYGVRWQNQQFWVKQLKRDIRE